MEIPENTECFCITYCMGSETSLRLLFLGAFAGRHASHRQIWDCERRSFHDRINLTIILDIFVSIKHKRKFSVSARKHSPSFEFFYYSMRSRQNKVVMSVRVVKTAKPKYSSQLQHELSIILSYMTLKQLATGCQGRKTVYRLVKFGYF